MRASRTGRTTVVALAVGSILVLSVPGCGGSARADVHEFGGAAMGSTYEVKFVGDVPLGRVRAEVESELASADEAFSLWREDSEISRFNRFHSTEPFAASPRMVDAARLALDLAGRTEGAFDPTVEPLTSVYRAARQRDRAPSESELDRARSRVGYRRLRVEGAALVKEIPDLRIDLDGIVAGLCADRIAARLDRLGVRGFYLQITGEVYCRGVKAEGSPWRIAVRDPLGSPTDPATVLELEDRALCTSGDYENYIVSSGRVWHHVFDPRTGRNPKTEVVSVSVLARSCALADGLGTALMVLGPEKAAGLFEGWPDQGLGALFFLPDPGGLRRVEVGWPGED
ncbi:MAG: FAD:protein FMN transferase [Planctomycetota bacterium]